MTREIPLTKGLVALVDEADFDWLSASKWCANGQGAVFYASRWNGALKRNEGMHRVLTGAPAGMVVDHANHDTLDNRRANLRVCTIAENVVNTRRPLGASGFRGVFYSVKTGHWRAVLTKDSKRHYVGGYHASPEAAALSYDEAAARHHGEFAILNFPARRRAAAGGLAGPDERDQAGSYRSPLDRDLPFGEGRL